MRTEEVNKMLDLAHRVAEEAFAYSVITSRADEAQEYCQKYLMDEAWGRNIWHAILDDAIRMRSDGK